MDVLILLLLLPLLLLFLNWYLRCDSNAPLALPIIGHLHLLGSLPHRSLFEISKKYGPLFRLRLGSVPVVVVSDSLMAKEFLKTHDHVFASRPPPGVVGKYLFYREDPIFAPYGEHWRTLRMWCMQELLSKKNIKAFQNARKEELVLMMGKLVDASRAGEAVTIMTNLTHFTYNIITRMIIGKAFFASNSEFLDDMTEFTSLIEEKVTLSGQFHIGDFVPWLLWLDSSIGRMKSLRKRSDKFWQGIVDEHRERMQRGCIIEDFLSTVLPRASDTVLKALIEALITAGTDAAGIMPEWALAELLEHPQAMKKAREELDIVVGKCRLVQEQDLPKLKYLQSVIKETFRLHPSVPLGIPHQSTETCKVGGLVIQEGTRVIINIFAVGRDPVTWENPSEFNPDRFAGKEIIDGHGNDFHVIPFSSGKRGCPGRELGLTMVELALANLVHGFDWTLPHGRHPMEERFGLVTPLAVHLIAIPSLRLPLAAYNNAL